MEVSLNKPLRPGGPVISPEREETRVAFQYERLVRWCFNCGRIGHEQGDCSVPVSAEKGERPNGEWLKAGYRTRTTESSKEQPQAR